MKYAEAAEERKQNNAARNQAEEAVESPRRKLASRVGVWAKGSVPDGMSRFRKRGSVIAPSPTSQYV